VQIRSQADHPHQRRQRGTAPQLPNTATSHRGAIPRHALADPRVLHPTRKRGWNDVPDHRQDNNPGGFNDHHHPAGVVYADRQHEKDGDYARCAFLPYDDLTLKIEPDCAAELRPLIEHDASEMQAKRGQEYQVSSSGQTVLLGSALPKRLVDVRRQLGHNVDGEPVVVEQPPALPGYEDREPQPLARRIGMERVPDHMLPPPTEQPPAPVIEPTDQGDQIVIPGGERSAIQAAAARNAAGRGRMRSRRPQRDPGGLFEPDPYPVQQRLFD
jgi:hypothetical protein